VANDLGAAPLLEELGVVRAGADVGLLTPRESEILALVASGRSNPEIGKQLFISAKTVSVHVSNVMAKLGASSRTEAAALARRAGLVD
jgi:DNA-binding NarL/FixJ family response regulator